MDYKKYATDRWNAKEAAEHLCEEAATQMELDNDPSTMPLHKLDRLFDRWRRMRGVACSVAKRLASDLA
jgi:hypothetical protein